MNYTNVNKVIILSLDFSELIVFHHLVESLYNPQTIQENTTDTNARYVALGKNRYSRPLPLDNGSVIMTLSIHSKRASFAEISSSLAGLNF